MKKYTQRELLEEGFWSNLVQAPVKALGKAFPEMAGEVGRMKQGVKDVLGIKGRNRRDYYHHYDKNKPDPNDPLKKQTPQKPKEPQQTQKMNQDKAESYSTEDLKEALYKNGYILDEGKKTTHHKNGFITYGYKIIGKDSKGNPKFKPHSVKLSLDSDMNIISNISGKPPLKTKIQQPNSPTRQPNPVP